MRPERRKPSSFPPTTRRRKKRKPMGAPPNAPIIIPSFHNVGHKPVGSIAEALAPYKKFYGKKRAQDIAIEAAMFVGKQYPIIGKIVECWFLLPKHDREKVLALDYTVEAFNMPVREFVGIVRPLIQMQLLDRAQDIQFANMPALVEKSMKRAMNPRATTPVVKEAMAHMQQHRLMPAPPNAPSVTVNTTVGGPTTQVAVLPSAEDFAKRLDEATRAGREALPPANMEGVIDVEAVTSKTKDEVAA